MAHNIKVPDEYSGAFSKALRNFESHDSRTLDDALNIKGPMKTGKHQDAAKKEYAMASEVHCAIVEQRNQKVARDDGLFELVGEQFGIGKTTAKKYYYLEEKRMERLRGFLKAILIDDSYP